MNITVIPRSRIFQELQKFNARFLSTQCITLNPKACFVRCFSRYRRSTVSASSPQLCNNKSPSLTTLEQFRWIRTSSSFRTLSNLNDAFSEVNKARLVQQLGLMKPRKSLLTTCSEEAAVFVPFCIVDSTPSVLFTLRSSQLNSYRGEVSFPGGKKDPEDKSLAETAVREMEEELGLDRSCVHVWASMPPMPDRLGKTAITAVLGFIGEIDVNSLDQLNPDEVESVFTLSLEHLCSAENQRYTKFKHLGASIMKRPVFVNGPHRIWGLTAIVLDIVMATFCPEFYQKMFEIKGHGLR